MTPRDEHLQIIEAVAKEHGMTARDILEHRRKRPIVRARHAAIRAVAEASPDLSLPQLGRIFNRDHTSICFALGRIAKKRPVA